MYTSPLNAVLASVANVLAAALIPVLVPSPSTRAPPMFPLVVPNVGASAIPRAVAKSSIASTKSSPLMTS